MPTLRRKDLVCQEAIELLTEYLEGRCLGASAAD